MHRGPIAALATIAALAASGAVAASPARADISGRSGGGAASVQLSGRYLTIQIHRPALARRLAGRVVVLVCGRTLYRGVVAATAATWTPRAAGPARFSYTFERDIESGVRACGVRGRDAWYLTARLR